MRLSGRLMVRLGVALVVCVGVPAIVRAATPPERIVAPASASAGAVRGERIPASGGPAIGGLESVVVGFSSGGRPIVANHRQGSATTTRRVLVVGMIHGDEVAGSAVVAQLAQLPVPTDLDLWWVPTMNPDGEVSGRHGNGHGVDLNRNWPANWVAPGTIETSGASNSGSGPASEPETQAMMTFIAQIAPDVTVWFHQPWGTIDCNTLRVGPSCSNFAARVGMDVSFHDRPGTATDWIMSNGHGASFVVEFGGGQPSAATAARHAEALLLLPG
jgi:protein MpaA